MADLLLDDLQTHKKKNRKVNDEFLALESFLDFEARREEDGLIEDSNDDLEIFPNVVLVNSNLDEIRCMKLEPWKEDFEGRLDYSGIISTEVSNEKECDV